MTDGTKKSDVVVEEFIRALPWSIEATEWEKTLVAGNLRHFVEAAKDILALEVIDVRRQRDKALTFLEREGYRRCDMLACACGEWHRHPPVMQTHQPDCGLTRTHAGRCAPGPDKC